MSWQIRYFEEESGEIPAADFEDSLPMKMQGKLAKFARAVS
jgi:hypothetical protein